MDFDSAKDRELALPATSLTILRRSLRKEAGPLGATHALHAAGYATGESLLGLLEEHLGTDDPAGVENEAFWGGLGEFLRGRGWGSLEHERVHPALGLLSSRDWAEADPGADETQPSCPFTAGLLASVLGRVAGGPVAVLEVSCRSKGDEACRFAFGSEAAIHELYGFLLDNLTLEEALASL